jgi:hypothetical protein
MISTTNIKITGYSTKHSEEKVEYIIPLRNRISALTS